MPVSVALGSSAPRSFPIALEGIDTGKCGFEDRTAGFAFDHPTCKKLAGIYFKK